MKIPRQMTAMLLAVLLAGCAATAPFPSGSPSSQPATTGESRAEAPKAPNRNLSGYSMAFRQGYVEGCDSAGSRSRHRDEGRYKNDLDYLMGWNDGYSVCRR